MSLEFDQKKFDFFSKFCSNFVNIIWKIHELFYLKNAYIMFNSQMHKFGFFFLSHNFFELFRSMVKSRFYDIVGKHQSRNNVNNCDTIFSKFWIWIRDLM